MFSLSLCRRFWRFSACALLPGASKRGLAERTVSRPHRQQLRRQHEQQLGRQHEQQFGQHLREQQEEQRRSPGRKQQDRQRPNRLHEQPRGEQWEQQPGQRWEQKDGQQRRQWQKRPREQRPWRGLESHEVQPFVRDKGLSRQLSMANIDKDDPLIDTDVLRDDITLETMREESRSYRKLNKLDEEYQKMIAKRKIIEKKMFPKPKAPNLLTWTEKETIRYLNKRDPREWNVERLSESFPADPPTIVKILRNRGSNNPEIIAKVDAEVRRNWELLAKGQLELEPDLEQHIQNCPRKHLGLSTADELELEEALAEACQTRPEPLLPLPGTGEFASIIQDYERKVGRLKDKETSSSCGSGELPTTLTTMASLFGENTVPGTPQQGESSPYGETALLRTRINLAKERLMNVEMFRDKYISSRKPQLPGGKEAKTLAPWAAERKATNNAAENAFRSWLKEQAQRSSQQTRHLAKIDADTVLRDLSSDQQSTAKGVHHSGGGITADKEPPAGFETRCEQSAVSQQEEVYVYRPEQGYARPYVRPVAPDRIDIPEEVLRERGKVLFQLGDSFYDAEGEFLYRVPGAGSD